MEEPQRFGLLRHGERLDGLVQEVRAGLEDVYMLRERQEHIFCDATDASTDIERFQRSGAWSGGVGDGDCGRNGAEAWHAAEEKKTGGEGIEKWHSAVCVAVSTKYAVLLQEVHRKAIILEEHEL